jgi:glycosyltransferase involved in cell wall biosynthesis
MPTIAVVIPNRNDSRFLLRCLDSVLEQPVPADELIVVDDQSTDDSVALIRDRLADIAWARLVVNPVNLGTAGAVRTGLQQARCDYVLSLAANDLVLPGIFAHAKACLARSPALGIWSAMEYFVDETGRVMRLHASPVISLQERDFSPEQCIRMAYTLGNWFTGPTMIFHREALLAAGGFDTSDQGLADWIAALVLASKRGAAYTPLPLGAKRAHGIGLLARTLSSPSSLNALLEQIRGRAPQRAPQLFTTPMLDRFEARVRFAAIRSAAGVDLSSFAGKLAGLRGRLVGLADRVLPAGWSKIRVVLSFVLLTPFDLLPALWHRYACGALVRARLTGGGR